MKIALVNPPWRYDGSIYFGCREPHLPLELAYARALLQRAGHEPVLFDAHARKLDDTALRAEIAALRPALTVITTAPSYLFWRCAPPELRVPIATAAALRRVAGTMVAVGPHASTTPRATLRKLGVEVVVLGECEEILVQLASTPADEWWQIASIAHRRGGLDQAQGGPHASNLRTLPALRWERAEITAHAHHHHRFDAVPEGPGAELEASRGCPYRCTFCAKENFRDKLRRRPLETVLDELDGLIELGVRYVYFIDEIFLPDPALLEALAARDIVFGVQLRIDKWSPDMLDLLGAAGCVSIEAGVESITRAGRASLAKRCGASTEELTELLVHARRRVPFVQANLLGATHDDRAAVRAFREHLMRYGVWANDPVPLFPYPGSPEYTSRWGLPDDQAWERAHAYYLDRHGSFSDIQDSQPLSLPELEHAV